MWPLFLLGLPMFIICIKTGGGMFSKGLNNMTKAQNVILRDNHLLTLYIAWLYGSTLHKLSWNISIYYAGSGFAQNLFEISTPNVQNSQMLYRIFTNHQPGDIPIFSHDWYFLRYCLFYLVLVLIISSVEQAHGFYVASLSSA